MHLIVGRELWSETTRLVNDFRYLVERRGYPPRLARCKRAVFVSYSRPDYQLIYRLMHKLL